MFWCQGAQNIELSNRKIKPVLKCTVWSQWTPVLDRQTDERTDEHRGNGATIHFHERSRAKESHKVHIYNECECN